jgi:hypothetical protein
MSLTVGPRCRPVVRGAAAGAVVLTSVLLGAPAASAADDGRPVITLDPPDVGVFLVPQENGDFGSFGGMDVAAASPEGAEAEVPDPLEQAAAYMPDEVAAALGVEEVGTESHGGMGGVDVQYGGTVVVRLPELVDASDAEFTLELAPADEDDAPYAFESDSSVPAHQLTVTELAPGEFEVTLPAAVPTYGPEAFLSVDRLTSAQDGVGYVFPLWYYLEFTGPGISLVELEPTLGVFSDAVCSIDSYEACTAATQRAGSPVDLVVPPTSLISALGYGRLDSAIYALESMHQDEPWDTYDSETTPELVTVHGPSSATLNVPAGARPGPYYGAVVEGDPTVGFAVTSFELEVEAVPVNPGLHSDTGWVEEVRDGSTGSTAAVAGGALVLVGGLVTLVAVRPGRRPPLGG